jgi:deoxyribose-phosphate aldolase
VATWEQIQVLCEEAIAHSTASVCIPPAYVKRVAKTFGKRFAGQTPKIQICTVIGFPLGYSTKETKVVEAINAIKDGATEIDTVINIGDVKNGDFDAIKTELVTLRGVTKGKVLKVIIETCYLTKEEKIRLCQVVTEAGADFIKTSTGFGTGGATLADVTLLRKNIGPKVRIKASGGMHSVEEHEAFFDAGCERLGSSSAVTVLGDE